MTGGLHIQLRQLNYIQVSGGRRRLSDRTILTLMLGDGPTLRRHLLLQLDQAAQ